ncbi:MAG: thiamine diphosphokinase, partial [Parabacteroides sp.]|nr:thiamine diphosphokinase [Parabacteroides sp.]
MITPYKCVVVANGSFPQTELPLQLLHQASTVIACDGAIDAL